MAASFHTQNSVSLVCAFRYGSPYLSKKPRRLGRGFCSFLEDNHRPLGGGQCSQQRYLTTSQRAEQINFRLWAGGPFTLRKPLCAYGLIAQLVQRSALTERAPTTSPRHPVGALSISGRLSWRPLSFQTERVMLLRRSRRAPDGDRSRDRDTTRRALARMLPRVIGGSVSFAASSASSRRPSNLAGHYERPANRPTGAISGHFDFRLLNGLTKSMWLTPSAVASS